MDPLTLVVTALAAGAATVGKTAASEAAKDAYKKLKERLVKSSKNQAEVEDALAKVEQKPDSKPRQDVLKEELGGSTVRDQPDLLKQAHALLNLLDQHGLLKGTTFQVWQSGSGAVVQGPGAAGAGAGGIAVAGDFCGNIYQGAHPHDDLHAVAIYREMLVRSCRGLPLRGMDIGASDPTSGQKQLELDQVYVSLDTTETVELEGEKLRSPEERLAPGRQNYRSLAALEATVAHRRIVLLGEPGSGKSTFVNHLCLCLAAHGANPQAGWLRRLADWPEAEGDLLPITVVLRDLVRTLPPKPSEATPRHLWNFIIARLSKLNLQFADKPLRDALEKGRAIVLCDGLDEILSAQHRQFVRDAVAVFAERYPKCRVLVTCRTLSYQNEAWKLRAKDAAGVEQDFPAFTLAAFDEDKIDCFIAAWFAELQRLGSVKAEDTDRLTRRLREAVRREDLWRLAPNPLLLTVMALVHTHKGELPDARALLYEETVDILLWRWEQIKLGGDGDAPGLRQLMNEAKLQDVDLKRALWKLAFAAHEAGGGQDALADISEQDLQDALVALHPARNHEWAHQVIQTIKLRAGLLLERATHLFTLPHRTFQEYLAGAHLANLPDFPTQSAQLAATGAFWREVILLAAGRLVYLSGDIPRPLALVGELCPAKAAATEQAWRMVWLAGEVLLEAGQTRARTCQLGTELLDRVRSRLATLLEAGALAPVERAKAGGVLARLGDPRPGVGVRADGLPDIDWIEIAPGPFLMGDKKDRCGGKRFECKLITQPYRISRYPVTVTQFEAFVQADDGYRERKWWTPAGWGWKGDRTRPEDYEPVFQTLNHPRVGVSWYEALAFCRWLSEQLQMNITLPSEAEWERAARHTDGRTFPWGNEDKDVPQRCNMGGTGLHHTSPVGMFPDGEAVSGAADMAGNVWEWTRSLGRKDWQKPKFKYPYRPNDGREALNAPNEVACVLRGGSWYNTTVSARCAYRGRSVSVYRFNLVGFRVVAASPSSNSGHRSL